MNLTIDLTGLGILFMRGGSRVELVKSLGDGLTLGESLRAGRSVKGDWLVGRLVRSLSRKVPNQTPEGGRVRRGRGGFYFLRPSLFSRGVDNFVNFFVKTLDIRISWITPTFRVSFTYQGNRLMRDTRFKAFPESCRYIMFRRR